MSDVTDFAREIKKRIDALVGQHTEKLIKTDAQGHDRLAGKIESLSELRSYIDAESRKWMMRQEEDIDA